MSGKWNNVLFLSFNFRVKHYSDHVPWELPTHSLSLFHVCAWNWQLCKPCTAAPFPLWPQKRQAAALWAPPVLTERSSYILLRSLSSTHAYSMQALSPLWRSGQGERRCDIRGGWSWPGLCYQSLRCLQWPSSKRCALTEPSDLTWRWQHQALSLPHPWLSPSQKEVYLDMPYLPQLVCWCHPHVRYMEIESYDWGADKNQEYIARMNFMQAPSWQLYNILIYHLWNTQWCNEKNVEMKKALLSQNGVNGIMPVFGCYNPLFCIFSFLFLFCFGSLEVCFGSCMLMTGSSRMVHSIPAHLKSLDVKYFERAHCVKRELLVLVAVCARV